jgi:hypothetical protein
MEGPVIPAIANPEPHGQASRRSSVPLVALAALSSWQVFFH